MGVIRVEHNSNYTTMSNFHLRDSRISLKAAGLMSKMLSLPDTWDYTVSGLASICKEGRDAIRSALMELEEAGYLVREQTHDAGGNFAGNDYTLYEEPCASPLTGFPSTVKPSTENPLTENPTQINNLLNQVKTEQKHAPAPKWEPEMFERFWKAYPCGKDKAKAREEWDKLRPDRKLMQTMSAALDRAKESDEWQRGIGIPYACRWLAHRRWEDELEKSADPDPAPDRKLAGERC